MSKKSPSIADALKGELSMEGLRVGDVLQNTTTGNSFVVTFKEGPDVLLTRTIRMLGSTNGWVLVRKGGG